MMARFSGAMAGLALLSPFAAHGAPVTRLDDASIRSFVAEQSRAWNARDFDRFYGTFASDAAIVLVTTHAGRELLRRVRTLSDDRRESEHFFARTRARIRETDRIERIEIAPDGRHARVRVMETTQLRRHGRTKTIHAVTEQTLAFRRGRIVSLQLMEFDTQ